MNAASASSKNIIIAGSVDQSSFIKKLIAEKKLNVAKIKDKWDAYQIQVIKNPWKGVDNALVITGGNKRGVAYGIFDISQQMGVSPWYWWADVPVKKSAALYIKANTSVSDAPKVKYRGIFINDEAPAFSGWTKEKFGGVNHNVYEKMFELILRLKGNYLWPAMWGNAFNDDDTLNPILADKWGIVMGTSHHEPMLRAQQEWKRYGKGAWDYTKNDSVLRAFWKKGIENMDHHESIVTIGMRGDGDKPMTQGTATALLERIVADQRKIIENVTGKPASETPQDWALYKEVQDYYDKGMRVPDDVTLLLCDDNWGNIRKLPKLT
ncbi:MAG: glycosyl hydrolase 115 family protein, partial [Ginsengibacter sp.]